MPPRRSPGPDQPDAQAFLKLIAAGDIVKDAAGACGLDPGNVWHWIDAGKFPEPPPYTYGNSGRAPGRMSDSLWRSCVKFSKSYEEAKLEGKRAVAQEALKTIRTAAMKGFARAKVTRKLIGGQVVEEKHESEQSAPVWQAAAWYLERTLPDEYSQRSEVRVSGELQLRPGEADRIAEACTDEEARAIDRGDASALARVLARVRAESSSKS